MMNIITQYLMEHKSSQSDSILTDMDFPVLELRVENKTFDHFKYCGTGKLMNNQFLDLD